MKYFFGYKNSLIFLGCIKLLFSNIYSIDNLALLNTREINFIQDHLVDNNIAKTLDAIFENLPSTLVDFFDGQNRESDAVIRDLLEKFNFEVIVLQLDKKKKFNNKLQNVHMRAILKHKSIPHFFLKFGLDHRFPRVTISRIVVMDFINSLIKSTCFGFKHWGFIEKKLYHRLNKPLNLSDAHYIVLSPVIEGVPVAMGKGPNLRYSNNEVEFLFKTLKNTIEFSFLRTYLGNAWDGCHPPNFIIGNDGLWYCIDTEPSMWYNYSIIDSLFFLATGYHIDSYKC